MVGSELGSNQHLQVEREIATRKDEEKCREDWTGGKSVAGGWSGRLAERPVV